jgi:tetraacyldisaccharide 4'-kinase
VAVLRALAYRRGWLASFAAGVPVIVIGNLSVGGTGKTPLVIWLVEYLRRRGHRPGIASRGYGGDVGKEPLPVAADADPARFGDEPVLLARRSGAPVVVARDRVAAARRLAGEHGCDVVVTDDGLQHYRLRRDLEVLVVDGARGFGNGRCLPAGPLREPVRRARRADLVIFNGRSDGRRPGMRLLPGDAVSLADAARTRPLGDFRGVRVRAVAGIGHPRRFFTMLEQLGLAIDPMPYPDHHRFSAADAADWGAGPVLMTEKDAVKLKGPALPDAWFVPVAAEPDADFIRSLEQALERLFDGGPA